MLKSQKYTSEEQLIHKSHQRTSIRHSVHSDKARFSFSSSEVRLSSLTLTVLLLQICFSASKYDKGNRSPCVCWGKSDRNKPFSKVQWLYYTTACEAVGREQQECAPFPQHTGVQESSLQKTEFYPDLFYWAVTLPCSSTLYEVGMFMACGFLLWFPHGRKK